VRQKRKKAWSKAERACPKLSKICQKQGLCLLHQIFPVRKNPLFVLDAYKNALEAK
jgi:hypothetical protein